MSEQLNSSTGDQLKLPQLVTELGGAAIGGLVEEYRRTSLVRIPGLITPEAARALLQMTQGVPMQDVTSRSYAHTWGRKIFWPQQMFEAGQPVHTFFGQPPLPALMKALTGSEIAADRLCWATRCQKQQEVGPHRDARGLIHLFVGLQSTGSPDLGGELVVQQLQGGEEKVFLTPGDAVAFDAVRLLHYTTPLVPDESNPDPERVVIIGRYYAATSEGTE